MNFYNQRFDIGLDRSGEGSGEFSTDALIRLRDRQRDNRGDPGEGPEWRDPKAYRLEDNDPEWRQSSVEPLHESLDPLIRTSFCLSDLNC